ncbi:MAG: hypothetical protein K5793_06030 [Nitrosarchaeum sp.]|nr:hypothetical protein [Nitrosarchaeum sp.]
MQKMPPYKRGAHTTKPKQIIDEGWKVSDSNMYMPAIFGANPGNRRGPDLITIHISTGHFQTHEETCTCRRDAGRA